MTLPPLPNENEVDWFDKRTAFDLAIGAYAEEAFEQADLFSGRVKALETLGGLAPGDITDATMTSVVLQPESNFVGGLSDFVTKKAVVRGDIVMSVYDYGAIDSATISSQSALDLCVSSAISAVSSGHKVTIQIPKGRVLGDLNITSRNINVLGPGSLCGTVVYKHPTEGTLERFYSKVENLVIRSIVPREKDGVRITGGAMIEVSGCTFYTPNAAIHADTWINVSGQQNKTINVHDNTIIDCNYAWKSTHNSGTTWQATADSQFTDNTVRLAYIRGLDVPGADGFDVSGNRFFAIGWSDSNEAIKELKEHTIRFGTNSNYVTITDNHIFESGEAGIALLLVQNTIVRGNQIIWPGQRIQSSGILITTDASMSYAPRIIISGNLIDSPSRHGVHILGSGKIDGISIDNANAIMLRRTKSSTDTYYGTATLDPLVYRVKVEGSITGRSRIDLISENGSREGVLSVNGLVTHSRRQISSNLSETLVRVSKTITTSTPVALCYLRGHTGSATTMAGTMEVAVVNTADSTRIGFYSIDVGTGGATLISATGRVTEANVSGNYSPAFTFSKTGSGSVAELTATPIGATIGIFNFEILAHGFLQIGMMADDDSSLTLNN